MNERLSERRSSSGARYQYGDEKVGVVGERSQVPRRERDVDDKSRRLDVGEELGERVVATIPKAGHDAATIAEVPGKAIEHGWTRRGVEKRHHVASRHDDVKTFMDAQRG